MTTSLPSRPNWDETRIAGARVMAKRSLCARDQVGAVITDVHNKIIGEGYNGPPRGFQFYDRKGDCVNWCDRARERAITGWTGGTWSGTLEVSDKAVWHKVDGFDPVQVKDANEFMRRHGSTPVYEERTTDYSDCPALHAEANALMMSNRSLRRGGTIYVTSDVCFGCAKLIANSGLNHVVVLSDGGNEHRNASKSYDFLKECGLSVTVYDGNGAIIHHLL